MQQMTETTDTAPVENGVNTEALLGARAAFEQAPEAAMFTWKARCDWVYGTHSQTTVNEFAGLGDMQTRRQSFTIDADHPEVFAAQDNGATPAEIVLSALGSCLMGGLASIAQHRGIQIRKATAHVEGDMNLQGIMGVDPDVRNGFSAIRVSFDIDADAEPDEIKALVAQSQKRSAVFDLITNPTRIAVKVD